MEEKKKSPYNMWQNTGFMLSAAWRSCPSVIFLCIALAVVTAAQTVAELLIAPAVIARVEEAAPLESLLLTIAGFSLLLLLLSGLKRYLDTNTLFGRVNIRLKLARQLGLKASRTSYPNLMDARFTDLEYKAMEAFDNNDAAAEHIWTTWTTILTNLLGCILFCSASSPSPPLWGILWTRRSAAGATGTGRRPPGPSRRWAISARPPPAAPTPRTSACSAWGPG